MTDLNPLNDQNQTPEDVATLYSWANLHGAKYRDFSASRAQTREKARLRAEQALDEQQKHKQEGLEAAQAQEAQEAEQAAEKTRTAEVSRQAELAAEEAARHAEWVAQQEAEQARIAAQRATEEAARQAASQAAEYAARIAAEKAARQAAQEAAERASQQALQRAQEQAAQLAAQQAAQRAAQQAADQVAQQRAWQQRADRSAVPPAPPAPVYAQPQGFDYPSYPRPQAYRPAPTQPQYAPMPEEAPVTPRNPWAVPEMRDPVGRPAWLTPDSAGTPGAQTPQSPMPKSPEDTLQGSRDRLTNRWFALRGIFDPTPMQPEAIPAPVAARAPAMAVFSLAGGVGKTSLVATLGRALSARGERVLLVDTAAFGLLPFFFGATDQRPGLLRTFSPPGVSSDAPVQMVTIDPEGLAPEQGGQESLSGEIAKFARGASRVIVDLATASGATTRRIMRMAPLVLVPVVPDMNSVVSVSSIDAFFEHNNVQTGKPALPYYVLNQFDASLPLHLDVREVLREQLGERLLPFALRRTAAMSEALAEGMTVMDYAPGSALTEDFATLAGWVKSLSAPATTSYRGVRWSER